VQDSRDEEERKRERQERLEEERQRGEEERRLDEEMKPHEDGAANDSVPEGFERACVGPGNRHCKLIETQEHAGQRYKRARQKALDEMDVNEEELASDPERKRELERRTKDNYEAMGTNMILGRPDEEEE